VLGSIPKPSQDGEETAREENIMNTMTGASAGTVRRPTPPPPANRSFPGQIRRLARRQPARNSSTDDPDGGGLRQRNRARTSKRSTISRECKTASRCHLRLFSGLGWPSKGGAASRHAHPSRCAPTRCLRGRSARPAFCGYSRSCKCGHRWTVTALVREAATRRALRP
jgi:hypothetical protein